MKIDARIVKMKQCLILKTKREGLYENFGQKVVLSLKEKFGYNPYGDHTERYIARAIDDFDNWCSNYTPLA